MSDLHFEFHRDGGRKFVDDLDPQGAKILILAGDVIPVRFLDQVRRVFRSFLEKYETVIFVPGNHEYYGSEPQHVSNLLTAMYQESGGRFVVLDPGYWMGHGLKIVGATMWFRDHPMNAGLAHMINDFDQIKKFVPWIYEKNAHDLKFLYENVREGDIVVTHHLPTPLSHASRFKDSNLNRFFLCDVSELILENKPKLWVHGHSHDPSDYVIGSTHVVANPLGYPKEVGGRETGFDESLFIDV